jgi:hypothetical protein
MEGDLFHRMECTVAIVIRCVGGVVRVTGGVKYRATLQNTLHCAFGENLHLLRFRLLEHD